MGMNGMNGGLVSYISSEAHYSATDHAEKARYQHANHHLEKEQLRLARIDDEGDEDMERGVLHGGVLVNHTIEHNVERLPVNLQGSGARQES